MTQTLGHTDDPRTEQTGYYTFFSKNLAKYYIVIVDLSIFYKEILVKVEKKKENMLTSAKIQLT
jgi:hypothetical protein